MTAREADVRRVAGLLVLVPALVLLQLMAVDRLPLPGGSVPDVALLAVAALGLTQGPATGALVGFCSGLGLDLAPPASHLIGKSALVFCLVGYGCGGLGRRLNRSPLWLMAAALIGAAIGETLAAAISLAAGDPGATLPAVRHALPVAVLYDALLSPVVTFLTSVAGRRLVRVPSAARRADTGPVTSRLASGGRRFGAPGSPATGPVRGRRARRPRLRLDGGSPAVRYRAPGGVRSRLAHLRLGASRRGASGIGVGSLPGYGYRAQGGMSRAQGPARLRVGKPPRGHYRRRAVPGSQASQWLRARPVAPRDRAGSAGGLR